MKSWKTTLAGILLAIGQWASSQAEPWWLYKLGNLLNVVAPFMLGAAARDNAVPSSAVPKAAAADAQIKGDTATLTKP